MMHDVPVCAPLAGDRWSVQARPPARRRVPIGLRHEGRRVAVRLPPLSRGVLRRWTTNRVIRNASALYGTMAIGMLTTLVMVTFLSRVLGPAHWGQLILAQALAGWLGIAVAYGFGLGGTRAVARVREDRAALARLASGVLGAQGLLLLASAPLPLLALGFLPPFRHHAGFVAAAWSLSIAGNAGPRWYFQGVERMGPPSWAGSLSGVGAACLTLLLVHRPTQALAALWIQAGATALGTAWLFWRMYREIPWVRPGWADAMQGLRTGWSMFLFKVSVRLYTNANTLILGLFVPASLVSFYGAAEKINKQVLGLIAPISTALFPRLSHLVQQDPAAARHLARLNLGLMTAFGLAAGGLVALFAPLVVHVLLGPRYGSAVPLVRLLAALLPAIAVSTVLGGGWMVPLGLDRDFNRIIASAGVLNVAVAVALVHPLGDTGMALAVVSAEWFVTLSMAWVLQRRGAGLLGWTSPTVRAASLPPGG